MNVYWLLIFLPKWVIAGLLVVGSIGLLASILIGHLPFIKTYNLPIKVISLALLVVGVYLQGAVGYKDSIAKSVAELQAKLAKAESQSNKVNTEIVTKVLTQTQVIHEKGKTITAYIDREVPKYDQTCKIPKEVIVAHNMAATLDTDPAKVGEKP